MVRRLREVLMRVSRPALTVLSVALLATSSACASGKRVVRAEPSPAQRANPAGAVTALDATDLEQARSSSLEEILAGRVPGLQVSRTSSGDYTLRIRNAQSFLSSDEPLLVIDNMPVRAGGASSALRALHPLDIARVEVLRDGGSTAFWGVRGANGVILITTKLRN